MIISAETLEKNDLRRKELIEVAKKEKEVQHSLIRQAEKEARQNDMPKRKAVIKKKDQKNSGAIPRLYNWIRYRRKERQD